MSCSAICPCTWIAFLRTGETRDLACADLQKLSTDKEDIRDLYIDYLTQYRRCLAETEIDKLDSEWCTLDEKWMQIRYPIQVVHDIECAPANPQHLDN